MTSHTLRIASRNIFITLGICSCLISQVLGQQFSETELKGAFIYNFMQNVVWDSDDDISELVIVLYGDDEALYEELSLSLADLTIRGKQLQISLVNELEQIGNVHVLVISESENEQLESIAATVRRTNTLLITNRSPQNRSIMINFLNPEPGRISFEINRSNIVYEGLSLSNGILLLGGTELDIAELYREMETSLLEMRNSIQEQVTINDQLALQTRAQEQDIQAHVVEIQQFEDRELQLIAELATYNLQITESEESLRNMQIQQGELNATLQERQRDLELALNNLLQRRAEVMENEAQLLIFQVEMASNSEILEQQIEAIREQQENIDRQNDIMQELGTTVENQRSLLTFITLLLLAFAFLLVIVFLGNRKLREMGHVLQDSNSDLLKSKEEAESASVIAQSTVQNMSQGILMVDGEGDVLIYNDAFLEYLNISKEQAQSIKTGVELGSFVSSNIGEEGTHRSKQWAEEGGVAAYEYVTPDGKFLDVRQNPLSEGGFVRTYTDITEQKLFEEELRIAKREAESATEAKSSFLASMSHEIRTPMNGVIGMVELLGQSRLNGKQKQMLQTIRDSGQSLLTIINDILDFSKIESGKLTLETIPMSLVDVVEGAIQSLAAIATEKGLRLISYIDPELPQFVIGDPVRVRQIIINLTGNAIKFTEEGMVVVKAEESDSRVDDKLTIRLSVRDQGIGISEEDQANLFQAFSQVEVSTTRQFGGTGLGLNICKMLTDLMGGEIGVNSKTGEGAEFYTIIPFGISEQKHEELGTVDLSSFRILLVNNNPIEQTIFTNYLEYWQISVDLTDNIESTLDQCLSANRKGATYDVVIFGPQWSRDELFAISEASRAASPKTQFIFLLPRTRHRMRQEDKKRGIFLDVNSLRRAELISAIAVAVGVESPEAQYREVVENMKANVKALTVAEAREQGTLILVAEDNATNRDVIGRQLTLLGYTCEMVEDGKIALDAWRSNEYGMLLTDCNMPNMGGIELTRAIRQDEAGTGRHGTIVAITANVLEGEAERCLASGMDDFVSKPIELKEFRRILRKWMPQAQSETETTEVKATASSSLKEKKKAKTANKPPATLPIDESTLKSNFGDDPEIFKQILSDFVEPTNDIILEIQSAYASHSAEAIKQGAHKLKSAAYSVGANDLAELCKELEYAGGEDDWEVIDKDMEKLEGLMSQVQEYISKL